MVKIPKPTPEEQPPLKVFQEEPADTDASRDANAELIDLQQHLKQAQAEAFWAGRNHAMRKSARVAA